MNNHYKIEEVNSPALQRLFIEMAPAFYKNDPNYIRPLDNDVNAVFDTDKNKAFRNGTLCRWILFNDQKTIGRIAAFVNKKYKNKGDDIPVGGIGFFECENDQTAANMLLDKAKDWLSSQGVQAMDGPINFGERDRWWGMVCEGFDQPLYCMNYNPPYYNDLFTTYGFKPFYYQLCYSTKPKDPLSEKMWQRHDQIAENPDFSSQIIDKNNLEKYAKDFATVYNKAWAGHGGMKQMPEKQAIALFKTMKPIMDANIVFYIYYKNEPVGIFVNLPDLNQWFKYLNGKFGLLQKLKFLWLKATKKNNKFTGLVFGIVPEWQGKGVDSYLVGEAAKYVQSDASPYTLYEMQWIGDFNPKMINVAQNLGDVFISRKLVTYRYLFDKSKEFHRHPIFS